MSTPPHPKLLEVREKILKWNDRYRVSITGSKMEVHNHLADFGQILWGVDGEGLSANNISLTLHFNAEINNILNYYAAFIHNNGDVWTADVLAPGNILEVKQDECRAILNNCDRGCWEKVVNFVKEREGEIPWKQLLTVVCPSCKRLIVAHPDIQEDKQTEEKDTEEVESEEEQSVEEIEEEDEETHEIADAEMTGIMSLIG